MKNINLKLTDNEYRALKEMIYNGVYACQGGCVYDELVGNKIGCDKCSYTIAREKLESLFEY